MKKEKTTIAVLGSHSALDICRGAKDEGFSTIVIAQKGREKTYNHYYATQGELGCVDECIVLNRFEDILQADVQKKLLKKNAIFIPNRSFEVYLHSDYEKIERLWNVPTFGNKFLLKIEERSLHPNQYDLLKSAGIRYPKHFSKPTHIDRLCLVKVSEKERPFERAFFLAHSEKEYKKKSEHMMKEGHITAEALHHAVIEEFVVGAQLNFNFFYSPLSKSVELLGTDTRRQTNLDGMLRIPAGNQHEVLQSIPLSYEEAGHIAVTVLESLLEPAFAMGEKFVQATQSMCTPGIIGPFSLQSIITPGPPKKDIVVIDVSPRMPGSPGISATPYSQYLYGHSMSVGRRVAQEIRGALKKNEVHKITT